MPYTVLSSNDILLAKVITVMYITEKFNEEAKALTKLTDISYELLLTHFKAILNKLKIRRISDFVSFAKVEQNKYATNVMGVYQERQVIIYIVVFGKNAHSHFKTIENISVDFDFLDSVY